MPVRSPASAASEQRLIDRYVRTRDPASRDALVTSMLPLSRTLAHKYHAAGQAEDLEQVAAIGLLKAIDRFDPEHGASLRSYAIPTILGELRRYLRDHTWSMHVARRLQERVLLVTKATERLTPGCGQAPTPAQLAQETGLSEEDVIEALVAGASYRMASLDAPTPEGAENWTLGDAQGVDDEGFAHVDERTTVAALTQGLDDTAKKMLVLRYAEDRTQTDIAAELGCSQMHVSRTLRTTIRAMARAAA